MDHWFDLLCFILGVFVGGLGSLLGIGGGVIIVPVLSLYLGVPMVSAISTSILSVLAMSCVVVKKRIRSGLVKHRFALPLELMSLLGGWLGALFAIQSDKSVLLKILSVVVIGTSILFAIKNLNHGRISRLVGYRLIRDLCYNLPRSIKLVNFAKGRILILPFLTMIIGFLSGLLGIGGGILVVPLLNLIGKLDMRSATSTSSYMMGLTACGSGATFLLKGLVDPYLSLMVISGVYLGSWFSLKLFKNIDSRTLSILFCVVLIFFGVKLWMNA